MAFAFLNLEKNMLIQKMRIDKNKEVMILGKENRGNCVKCSSDRGEVPVWN